MVASISARATERVVPRGVVAGAGVGACLRQIGRRCQMAFEHEPSKTGGVKFRLVEDAVGEGLGG
jgi:hypothetical protein